MAKNNNKNNGSSSKKNNQKIANDLSVKGTVQDKESTNLFDFITDAINEANEIATSYAKKVTNLVNTKADKQAAKKAKNNAKRNKSKNYASVVANAEGSTASSNPGTEVPFEDDGASENILKKNDTPTRKNDNSFYDDLNFISSNGDGSVSDLATSLSHYMHMPGPGERYENLMYNSIFRWGAFNTSSTFNTGKEFLFFTKPDLNIFKTDDNDVVLSPESPDLNPGLTNGFWQDVLSSKKRIVEQLQSSYGKKIRDQYDPFNHLLQNQCTSNLDIPSLSATSVDTATNMYGVGFSYRGSSEESDDQVEFSLEFKDTKWLDIYYYFKCFEEYETEKHHGTVRPSMYYINNRIIHDQFSIFKFIVGDDMETLVYWGKFYGVMPMSLPRDTFSTDNFDNGLSHSINFKAAFYEDMRPEILSDFNELCKDYWNYLGTNGYNIGIYNPVLGRSDGRWPKCAHILTANASSGDKIASISPNQYRYKLAWRGDSKV